MRSAAAVGVGAVALGALSGCESPAERELPSDPVVVDDDTAAVVTGEDGDFKYVESSFEPTDSWTLPLGTVLHPGEGTWLPAMLAGSSAMPMVKGATLNTESGALEEVLPGPVGADADRLVIYDVRCSDTVYAWVELDLQTRGWVLYGSALSAGALSGGRTVLWKGDGEWSPPRLAVAGNRVIWQVMPTVGGAHTSERSTAYLWHLGDGGSMKVVAESPGRFVTAPTVSGDTVTLTPRVREGEGVFYGVTAYLLSDDLETPVDRLVMPQGIRPFYAVRLGERFAISVEANYASGGLLGQMGTYFGVADGPFTRVPLEPFADVAGTAQGRCVVKSRASYYVIDLEAQTYAVLGAANRCVDYGEYPARVGLTSSFVTYSTVKDADTGYPTEVAVRKFAL